MSVKYRLAEPEDHAATYGVVTEAMGEYLDRHNLPLRGHGPGGIRPAEIQPRDLAFREYAHRFHRDSYWVAEDEARVVGFGIGIRHEGRWYLAALHVLPEYQGQGIGQRLLELTLSSLAKPTDALCVLADSIQPVSNAMYIRAKMLPWVPIFEWDGPISRLVQERPNEATFRAATLPTELEPVDLRVMGVGRPTEHQFWLERPELECGVLLVDGEPAGYVYVSDSGEVGPAAATAEPLMKSLLEWALWRLRERGVENMRLKIPGQCPSAQQVARSLGLRLHAPANILLSSRPLWSPGQYLVSAGDALL